MKIFKIIFCLLFICTSLIFAQNENPVIEVKSFEIVPTGVTPLLKDYQKIDQNGDPFAIIQIRVEPHVTIKELEGFSFSVGAMFRKHSVVMPDKGEIWLYVQRKAQRLTIYHSDFGRLDNYSFVKTFPGGIEAGKLYKMTLGIQRSAVTIAEDKKTENKFTQQTIAFTVEPSNARIEIGGKTYYADKKNGACVVKLDYGEYEYKVLANDHHDYVGRIRLDNSDSTIYLPIKLDIAYGWVKVNKNETLTDDVRILVDNVDFEPGESKRISSGSHVVNVIKKFYKNYQKVVFVEDGDTLLIEPELEPNFTNVTIEAIEGAEIWVENEKKGVTSWTGPLEYGQYSIRAEKASHGSMPQNYIIEENGIKYIKLEDPVPLFGFLSVNVTPFRSEIYVDGEYVGMTPKTIKNLLVGEHKVTVKAAGKKSYSAIVNIENNEDYSLHYTLEDREETFFSISETLRAVFAPGNLQYNVDNHSWRFAENQYDVIGLDERNKSEDNQWIDLFVYPIDKAQVNNNRYDWSDIRLQDANEQGEWTILSSQEWFYLLNIRPNADKLYAYATILGVNGLVLFPDNHVRAGMSVINTQMGTISPMEWEVMEKEGIVFLPINAIAYAKNVVLKNRANYWTQELFLPSKAYSFYFDFDSNKFYEFNPSDVNAASSVRCVQVFSEW